MIDSPRGPAARPGPGTPGWVKAIGIATIIVVALAIVVMVIGGGEHGPGRHASSAGAAGQTEASGASSTACAVGEQAEADEATRSVAVRTLDSMAFEPSRVDVSAGETVTSVVTNPGQAIHEFTLGEAAMQQEHTDAMAHMPAGLVRGLPNSITLRPGETNQLTWRFDRTGTLGYACHEPGHYEAGMRAGITVI
ncbi:MAG: plastocyanin/azurin family copper-binding protein [Chloroflexota bacterium]|nr:plastocyanin/azurin family copper-binding protein [Chloroflexota bacterium]